MSRYIDADKIPVKIRLVHTNFERIAFEEDINKVPTADVKPVVRGEWINGRCSKCGEQALYRNHYEQGGYYLAELFYSDYCPNCGADMRKEDV